MDTIIKPITYIMLCLLLTQSCMTWKPYLKEEVTSSQTGVKQGYMAWKQPGKIANQLAPVIVGATVGGIVYANIDPSQLPDPSARTNFSVVMALASGGGLWWLKKTFSKGKNRRPPQGSEAWLAAYNKRNKQTYTITANQGKAFKGNFVTLSPNNRPKKADSPKMPAFPISVLANTDSDKFTGIYDYNDNGQLESMEEAYAVFKTTFKTELTEEKIPNVWFTCYLVQHGDTISKEKILYEEMRISSGTIRPSHLAIPIRPTKAYSSGPATLLIEARSPRGFPGGRTWQKKEITVSATPASPEKGSYWQIANRKAQDLARKQGLSHPAKVQVDPNTHLIGTWKFSHPDRPQDRHNGGILQLMSDGALQFTSKVTGRVQKGTWELTSGVTNSPNINKGTYVGDLLTIKGIQTDYANDGILLRPSDENEFFCRLSLQQGMPMYLSLSRGLRTKYFVQTKDFDDRQMLTDLPYPDVEIPYKIDIREGGYIDLDKEIKCHTITNIYTMQQEGFRQYYMGYCFGEEIGGGFMEEVRDCDGFHGPYFKSNISDRAIRLEGMCAPLLGICSEIINLLKQDIKNVYSFEEKYDQIYAAINEQEKFKVQREAVLSMINSGTFTKEEASTILGLHPADIDGHVQQVAIPPLPDVPSVFMEINYSMTRKAIRAYHETTIWPAAVRKTILLQKAISDPDLAKIFGLTATDISKIRSAM